VADQLWLMTHIREDEEVKNHPILIKFGTLQQILNPMTVNDQKFKFLEFKMAAAAILKIAFLAITHRPIVRFQRNFV